MLLVNTHMDEFFLSFIIYQFNVVWEEFGGKGVMSFHIFSVLVPFQDKKEQIMKDFLLLVIFSFLFVFYFLTFVKSDFK